LTPGYLKASPKDDLELAQSLTDDKTKQLAVYYKLRFMSADKRADWYKAKYEALLIEKSNKKDRTNLKIGITIGATALIVAGIMLGGAKAYQLTR